jgi:hypothetical protein
MGGLGSVYHPPMCFVVGGCITPYRVLTHTIAHMIHDRGFIRSLLGLSVLMLTLVAACSDSNDDTHADDGRDHVHSDESETAQMREWSGSPVPRVELSFDDSLEHTLLVVVADGFTFTTADVTDPVDGEGHGHLYVDGELLTMFYEPEFQLPHDVVAEHHVLTVTLSTNDHLEYTKDGEPVGESILVGIQENNALADESAVEHHTVPVVPDDSVIDVLHGVVVDIDGDLTTTHSFTILLDTGDEVILYPTAEATFHSGPMGHIRDHILSGVPVNVDYVILADGTYAAVKASDH